MVRMARYVVPPDLPADVEAFMALSMPLAWGLVRQLRGSSCTMRELRAALGADEATLTKRLDALTAVGLVRVTLAHGAPLSHRQGHVLHYSLDVEAFDALVRAWLAYVRAQDADHSG